MGSLCCSFNKTPPNTDLVVGVERPTTDNDDEKAGSPTSTTNLYSPPGYDLTAAYNLTPKDHIFNGTDIDHVYKTLDQIGEGQSCIVSEVQDLKTGRKFVSKQMLTDNDFSVSLFVQEIKALKQLKSLVNVAEYHEHWIGNGSLFLITEYCDRGTLVTKILSLPQYSEHVAANYIKCILNVIAFMHDRNLIHRDLKEENILFSADPSSLDSDILKIIDFGDSVSLADHEYTTIYAGSQCYMAPQLFKADLKKYFKHLSPNDRLRYYGSELKKADMWSVGVIAYLIVCGRLPFEPCTNLPGTICQVKYGWPKDKNIPLSAQCKSFIQSLLVFDYEKRLSATQALQHPWLVGEASKTELGHVFRETITQFNDLNRQTKLALKLINTSSEMFF